VNQVFIEEIHIKDILSHRESKIRFKKGLNVIIGPNGAGKSTIIDSLVYALLVYGAGSEEIKRTSKADMVRAGAGRGDIRVVFSVGGHRYELQRTLSLRGESEDTLKQLSPVQRLIAVKSSVPREIYKILGISEPRILTSTVIARQDYINEILLEKPSERRERLLKLLGLDKLESARERVKGIKEKLGDEYNKLTLEIGRKKQIENELRIIEEEIRVKKEELAKLRPQLDELQKILVDKEGKRERIYRLLENLDVLRLHRYLLEELVKRRREYKEIKEKFSRYKDLDIERLKELREGMTANINRIRELESEIDKRNKELSNLRSSINNILNEIYPYLDEVRRNTLRNLIENNKYSEAQDTLNQLIKEINDSIMITRAQLQIYESFIKSFRETDRCPICGSPLTRDKLDHLLKEHEDSIKRLSEEINSRSDLLKRLRDIFNKFNENIRYVDMIQNLLNERNNELLKRRASVDDFLRLCSDTLSNISGERIDSYDICLGIIKKIFEEYPIYQERLRGLEREIEDLSKRLEETKGKVEVAEKDLREFLLNEGLDKYVGEDLGVVMDLLKRIRDDLMNEIIDLRKRYDELNKRVSSLEGEIRSRERDLGIKKAELEKLRDVEIERDKLDKIIKILEKLNDLFKKDGVIMRLLTSKLREALEKEVNRILREIGRGFRVSIEENFEISVIYGEDQKRPVENLSGGEKTMLSIAMRLALAKILTGRIPRFMILDEPTQNLDTDMRRMIFDIIKRIAGGMDQVIVVTHDEEIIEKADHLIRVVNEGGISRVYEE